MRDQILSKGEKKKGKKQIHIMQNHFIDYDHDLIPKNSLTLLKLENLRYPFPAASNYLKLVTSQSFGECIHRLPFIETYVRQMKTINICIFDK